MSLDSVKFLPRLDAFMLKEHLDGGAIARYGCREFHKKPAAAIGTT
jgi:hypothetical protein